MVKFHNTFFINRKWKYLMELLKKKKSVLTEAHFDHYTHIKLIMKMELLGLKKPVVWCIWRKGRFLKIKYLMAFFFY